MRNWIRLEIREQRIKEGWFEEKDEEFDIDEFLEGCSKIR